MKKTLIILILFFNSIISVSAEAKRIISGNENAKITIIAYESLTCSHCANFHIDIYPLLKNHPKQLLLDAENYNRISFHMNASRQVREAIVKDLLSVLDPVVS